MVLDVFFRSCSRIYSVHGVRRLVGSSKAELLLRCLNSLIKAMNMAGGSGSTEMKLHVIDDHSDPECLSEMHRLLKTCNFPYEFFALQETGNNASLKFHYELARERSRNLIYFVEDDYLHSSQAIRDMLASWQQLSFFLRQDIVLYPCDEPGDYLTLKPVPVLCSESRHWRTLDHTTATCFTSKRVLLTHWERYMALTHYSPEKGVHEGNTINLIYKTVPCFAPMPALAMHVVESKSVPPLVNWIEWWNQADYKVQQSMNPIIERIPPVSDARGEIRPLVDETMKSAVWITSAKGSVRANHYHKTDWHYCLLVKGAMEYYHRPAGSRDKPQLTKISAGQMFYTPPLVEHAMVFTEDSEFLCLGRNPRDQASYESDVVRVQVYPLA